MGYHFIKSVVYTCLLLCLSTIAYSQEKNVTWFKSGISGDINDTTRVEQLRLRSLQLQPTRPDSALIYAQRGLKLAQKLDYKKGQGNCLNRLGVLLWKNGKYDRALFYLLGSLKIREEILDRQGQLKSLNDIGIIYFDQKDYNKALVYQNKAKNIAGALHDKKRFGVILSNIGNSYIKLNKIDSAMSFEMQAYQIQRSLNDQGSLPNTVSILGDINDSIGHAALALDYYRLGLFYAGKNKDQTQLADTYNSIGLLYKKLGRTDSGTFYASKGLDAAKNVGYTEGIYTASNMLTQIYRSKNEHLELLYLKTAIAAKDSMFNANNVKQVQLLSFNEASRQQDILDEKQREADERIVNLQLIGIALFIPVFFVVLLLLSKSRTHRKVIEFMSVISLLLVFEFITLFIHPFVQRISNHMPVLELLILVVLASLLIPLHHNLTHWLREKLVHMKQPHAIEAPNTHKEVETRVRIKKATKL
jgi:tetratricopeptide (TPR) repeat protein